MRFPGFLLDHRSPTLRALCCLRRVEIMDDALQTHARRVLTGHIRRLCFASILLRHYCWENEWEMQFSRLTGRIFIQFVHCWWSSSINVGVMSSDFQNGSHLGFDLEFQLITAGSVAPRHVGTQVSWPRRATPWVSYLSLMDDESGNGLKFKTLSVHSCCYSIVELRQRPPAGRLATASSNAAIKWISGFYWSWSRSRGALLPLSTRHSSAHELHCS